MTQNEPMQLKIDGNRHRLMKKMKEIINDGNEKNMIFIENIVEGAWDEFYETVVNKEDFTIPTSLLAKVPESTVKMFKVNKTRHLKISTVAKANNIRIEDVTNLFIDSFLETNFWKFLKILERSFEVKKERKEEQKNKEKKKIKKRRRRRRK